MPACPRCLAVLSSAAGPCSQCGWPAEDRAKTPAPQGTPAGHGDSEGAPKPNGPAVSDPRVSRALAGIARTRALAAKNMTEGHFVCGGLILKFCDDAEANLRAWVEVLKCAEPDSWLYAFADAALSRADTLWGAQ